MSGHIHAGEVRERSSREVVVNVMGGNCWLLTPP